MTRDQERKIAADRAQLARHARLFHAHSRACFIEHWHWIDGKMKPHERVPANDNNPQARNPSNVEA